MFQNCFILGRDTAAARGQVHPGLLDSWQGTAVLGSVLEN